MDDETRRVGEIEADIAETRVELSETIEAIQERLTPSSIVANATESMRHAATEKVRQMTDNSFMDTVRANPVPSAMIGLGAAWLLFKGRSSSGNGYRSSRDWRSAGGDNAGAYGQSSGRGDYAVGTRGTAAYEGVSGPEPGYGESVGNIGRELSSRTREMAGDLGDTARETTRTETGSVHRHAIHGEQARGAPSDGAGAAVRSGIVQQLEALQRPCGFVSQRVRAEGRRPGSASCGRAAERRSATTDSAARRAVRFAGQRHLEPGLRYRSPHH